VERESLARASEQRGPGLRPPVRAEAEEDEGEVRLSETVAQRAFKEAATSSLSSESSRSTSAVWVRPTFHRLCDHGEGGRES
jgi:hypothetical protein